MTVPPPHPGRSASVLRPHRAPAGLTSTVTLLAALVLGLGSASRSAAQSVPKLNSLSPSFVQRGATTDITLQGENLGAIERFIVDGDPGLTVTNAAAPSPPPSAPPAVAIESSGGGISRIEPPPARRDDKKLVLRVTASADASLAPRELRVVSPTGVSNPLRINLGQWAETAEKEPNNSPAQAQAISLPATVSGTIHATAEIDAFRFSATKGQELVFEVDGARRGSALDSTLTLSKVSGEVVAENSDRLGLDSLLLFTVPDDSDYVLQLRDFRHEGSSAHTYRLHAGPVPYLTSIFPLGGQRGQKVEVSLTGANLADQTRMTWQIAPDAPLGRQEIRARTALGHSNPLPFEVQDLTETAENEPNNSPDKAQPISLPILINGRIQEPKDEDQFKFKSGQSQKLIAEVTAGRSGSPLDALLLLLDAQGKIIQQNDDAANADARLEFEAAKDAEYVLAIRDLTDRGGAPFAYRLSVRPPATAAASPDFSVQFYPDAPRLHRGGHAVLRCEVNRSGGFNGPIHITAESLPPGVFVEPLTLTPDPNSGLLLLTATPEASLSAGLPLRVVATASIGGKTVSRRGQPLLGNDRVRRAYLTVLDQAPFHIDIVQLAATAEQRQPVPINLLVQRRDGFEGAIKLVAEGFTASREPLTKNIAVKELTLGGTDTSGQIQLTPDQNSEIGTRTVVVRGETKHNGETVRQYSRLLPLTIHPIPFILSSTLSRLSVTALPPGITSAANEAFTTVRVERRAGFNGEVQLVLEDLPKGIKSDLAAIPSSQTETTLKLTATDQAAPGTNYQFKIVGTGLHGDRNFKYTSGPVKLFVSPYDPPSPPAATTTAAATAAAPDPAKAGTTKP